MEDIIADVLLLPLSGSDLVLGIQWFSALGPILWDFKNLTMEFQKDGKKIKLRGATGKKLKGLQASKLDKLIVASGEISMLQLIPREAGLKTGKPNDSDPEILNLLDSYASVSKEPRGSPHCREGFDHQIPVKEGTNPINLRPYRYSVLHKKCDRGNDSRIIRPRNN